MKTILLVEDNADLRELLTKALRYSGYDVVIATTGEEAVKQASSSQPDLILMDINLPKFNGAEATVKIKENRETTHIPIVILTALGKSVDTKHALEAGAAEILQKPIMLPRLREVLHKHLPVEVETRTHEIRSRPTSNPSEK